MIIDSFIPRGGHHCITNSLKQIFEYNNYFISEEMLFGLGSGLGFVYLNLKESPMISCRIKPMVFEQNIANRLGMSIKLKRPKDSLVAFKKLQNSISNNEPIMLYADMPYLRYLNMQDSGHFGGHSIVVFGFDDTKKCFYVSDRDNNDFKIQSPKGLLGKNFHEVPYSEMEIARASAFRPFPANNKWVKFDFSNIRSITKDVIYEALRINIDNMINAPANLLGLNGIKKFANEIKKWDKFENDKKN